MVEFEENGDIVISQNGLSACQYLEYYAMCITQYCKETADRNKRRYDLRGIVISNMANDLKSFVTGYQENKCKGNSEVNLTSTMIEGISDALEIFGKVYESECCLEYSRYLREEFHCVFRYREFTNKLTESLKGNGFIVSMSESASTDSMYLDIDYGNLMSVRISDHLNKSYEGIQVIFCDERLVECGTNYVYCIRKDYYKHDLMKVISFVLQNLRYQKSQIANKQYLELVKASKSLYKTSNTRFREVK